MKKLLGFLLLSLIMILSATGLTACGCSGCGCNGGGSNDKGTYYKYSDGNYDKNDYLILSGSSWTDDGGYSGTYEIKNGKITLYMTIYGQKEELYDGTIKDGVMLLKKYREDAYYCKEGCKPSLNNNNENNQPTQSETALSPTDSSYFEFHLLTNDTYEIKQNYEKTLPSAISLPSTYNDKPVTSIGDYAFYRCECLTSIEIPDSVTSIGWDAFCYCEKLTSVTIGNSVTSIGDGAFFDCRKLTEVTIGNSVTSIGYGAFEGCYSLTSIYYTGTASEWTQIYGLSYLMTSNITLYINNKPLTSVVLEGITTIEPYAFHDCNNLTSVTIGNSVTSIGDWAFCGCRSLTNINIPDSVTSIGSYAFLWCSSLTSVTIGNSVTSIGHGAFAECAGLKNITFKGTWAKWQTICNGYIGPSSRCVLHCTDGDVEI